MTKNSKTNFFYGYVIVVAAFCIITVIWGTFYSFGIFFKPVLTEFHWTHAMTSGAFSLCVILYGLLSIIIGRLNDKFGPRMLMTACGFFLGLGYLLMSQINAIWQLYLFYGVVIGIGMSGSFVPLMSTVSRWFVKRRGLVTGIAISGIGLGTVIIPTIASRLIAAYGWDVSYMIIGIIALVVIITAAQFLKGNPSQVSQLPDGREAVNDDLDLEAGGFSLQQAIHTRQFWISCAAFLCFGICLNVVMVHIASHAESLEISAIIAANILAVIGGVSILGRIIMGGTADRIGNKLTLTICFTLVSLALFWLQLTRELWTLYLFAAAFGFAYGGVAALMSPVVAELFGLSSHGVLLGFASFSFSIGGAIGPLLAGHIFDITESYQLAFLLCAIIGIMAIILTTLLRPIGSIGGINDSRRST